MKKLAIIGTTLIGSMMLCAIPLSLHFSRVTVVSVALDTADARVGRPATPGSVAGGAQICTALRPWRYLLISPRGLR